MHLDRWNGSSLRREGSRGSRAGQCSEAQELVLDQFTKASGGSLAALSLRLDTVAASEVLMLLVTLLAHVKWQHLLVICL